MQKTVFASRENDSIVLLADWAMNSVQMCRVIDFLREELVSMLTAYYSRIQKVLSKCPTLRICTTAAVRTGYQLCPSCNNLSPQLAP